MDEQDRGLNENGLSRRELVTRAGAVGAGIGLADLAFPAQFLRAATDGDAAKPITVGNPLARYPDRGWERVYRNQFAEDDSFVFTCAPNDTQCCCART
jgi:nitrate reductase alpha subunit